MGGQLGVQGRRGLNDNLDSDRPKAKRESDEPLTWSEYFDRACPLYMSMGMSYDMYWNGDCLAVKAYRKLNEIKQERQNEFAWQIGLYCYEAIASALSGKHRVKYPDAPHPLNTSISEERKERAQEQNERKVVDYMMTFAEQFNKRFESKAGKENKPAGGNKPNGGDKPTGGNKTRKVDKATHKEGGT